MVNILTEVSRSVQNRNCWKTSESYVSQAKALERNNANGAQELQKSLSVIASLNIEVEKDHGFKILVETEKLYAYFLPSLHLILMLFLAVG